MIAFGIDFGTTNSAAVELYGQTFREYGYGQKPLPSIVAIDKATGATKSGPEVREHQLELEQDGRFHVIRSVKTILDSEQHWTTERGSWTPPMVAAEVLRTLSNQVRQFGVEGGIRAATFGVPVGIRPSATRVLREAARIADIRVNGIVKESTAALFRHLEHVRDCRYVVVFDWGGGTLDVTVLEIRGCTIYERYVAGLPRAGDQIDEDLARRVHPYLCGSGASFDESPEQERDALRVQCEFAKCHLAVSKEVPIQVQYAGKPQTLILDREFCRPAIEPLVKDAIDVLATSVSGAGLSTDAIDQVIVIGGSSRLWLLRQMIEDDPRFAGIATFPEKPEWDVARGAAIVDQSPGEHSLAETIGLELSDGSYFELARPGDAPTPERCLISLALVEDVKAANVIIDRWDHDSAAHRELAVQFSVPVLGFDQEAVDLSWNVTEDLTMSVEGRSRAHGNDSVTRREITRLRFGYSISAPSEKQPETPAQRFPNRRAVGSTD
jgi:molecular chaperone DnaK